MYYQSQRLIIRPYTLADYEACQASKAKRQLGSSATAGSADDCAGLSACATKEEFADKVQAYQANSEQGYQHYWGLFLRDSRQSEGEFIGDVSLFTLNKQLKWANLGIHLQTQYHGKGFAKEACLTVITKGFAELGYHRIESGTELSNAAAIRLIESLGLVKEGIRRKFLPAPDSQDMIFFAANAIDWQGVED